MILTVVFFLFFCVLYFDFCFFVFCVSCVLFVVAVLFCFCLLSNVLYIYAIDMYPLNSQIESAELEASYAACMTLAKSHGVSKNHKRIPWHKRDYWNGILDPNGVQRSKTTGEPPLVLSNTVFFALRKAVREYRINELKNTDPFVFSSPATTYKIAKACSTS